MPAVTEKFGRGGRNITPKSQGSPSLATVLRAFVDDVAAIRTSFQTLTAKMDTDFTAQNIAVASSQLDENYATTCDPAAGSVTKG